MLLKDVERLGKSDPRRLKLHDDHPFFFLHLRQIITNKFIASLLAGIAGRNSEISRIFLSPLAMAVQIYLHSVNPSIYVDCLLAS